MECAIHAGEEVMSLKSLCHWCCTTSANQLQLAKEWSERGEPALAILAFEKSIKAFELENEVTPRVIRAVPRFINPLFHTVNFIRRRSYATISGSFFASAANTQLPRTLHRCVA